MATAAFIKGCNARPIETAWRRLGQIKKKECKVSRDVRKKARGLNYHRPRQTTRKTIEFPTFLQLRRAGDGFLITVLGGCPVESPPT